MGKPSSVFDKLGLGSKYRERAAFRHKEWKKKEEEKKTQRHREHPNHRDSGDRHPQSGGKKEGTVQVN